MDDVINPEPLWSVFINASLVNNFVFAYFLGICPFLGVSGNVKSAGRMGLAVAFVMLVATVCGFAIQRVLVLIDAPYLNLISLIAVIASTVQLIEIFVKKASPALFRALGIYLPLMTTNCAILGVVLFQSGRGYGFLQAITFGLGAGTGFLLALLLMAGLRERLDLVDPPDVVRGTVLTLVLAGILSLCFMGFSGIGGGP